jgi:hypothetical protein
MKKTLSILMITLLVSPVFAAWLPENVILSLHKNNLEHYVMGSHSHSEHQHSHEHSTSQQSQQSQHLHQSENLHQSHQPKHLPHSHQSQQEHGLKGKNDGFNQDTTLNDHHSIHFDITTYFSDTLNVELQRTSLSSTDLTVFDFSDLSSLLVTVKKPQHHYYLLPKKSHIPLYWKVFKPNSFPPYLATARLRI